LHEKHDAVAVYSYFFVNFASMMTEPRPCERLFLIINPISGTQSKEGLDRRIVETLGGQGFDVHVEFTKGPGDATVLAHRAVAEGYGGVLACGGDGTVNETARAMVNTGVAMGIVPAGSGNGLARHIGIPIDPIAALDIIAERAVRDCDYGTVNGSPFFCTFGVGFDAAVSDRFAASGSRGKMTYVRSAFEEFVRYRPRKYRIEADGEEIATDAYLVAVCNASQYGNNAYIAPHASITDGLLDIIVVRNMSKFQVFLLGMDLLCGTLDDHRGIIRRTVRHAVIERFEDGPAHLDGEPFTIGRHIEVDCHPGKLRLFTTNSKTPFRPVITPMEGMARDIGLTLKNIFR